MPSSSSSSEPIFISISPLSGLGSVFLPNIAAIDGKEEQGDVFVTFGGGQGDPLDMYGQVSLVGAKRVDGVVKITVKAAKKRLFKVLMTVSCCGRSLAYETTIGPPVSLRLAIKAYEGGSGEKIVTTDIIATDLPGDLRVRVRCRKCFVDGPEGGESWRVVVGGGEGSILSGGERFVCMDKIAWEGDAADAKREVGVFYVGLIVDVIRGEEGGEEVCCEAVNCGSSVALGREREGNLKNKNARGGVEEGLGGAIGGNVLSWEGDDKVQTPLWPPSCD